MDEGAQAPRRTGRTWAPLAAAVIPGLLLGVLMWTWYVNDQSGPPLIKGPSTIGAVLTVGAMLLIGSVLSVFRVSRRVGLVLLAVAIVAAVTRWGIQTYLAPR